MLVKTNGIVIRAIPYPNYSLVVKIYTLSDGLKSYFVKGVKGGKGKFKPAFFQPLSMVDLDVVHNSLDRLNKIKEIKFSNSLNCVSFTGDKSLVVLFLSEILYRVLKESDPNEEMFFFIRDSILFLGKTKKCLKFLIYFLLEFSMHLGFYPQQVEFGEFECYFDYSEGLITRDKPLHNAFVSGEKSSVLASYLNKDWSWVQSHQDNKKLDLDLILLLTMYYREQFAYFGKIDSLELLYEI